MVAARPLADMPTIADPRTRGLAGFVAATPRLNLAVAPRPAGAAPRSALPAARQLVDAERQHLVVVELHQIADLQLLEELSARFRVAMR